jgi:hypothetical protein
MKKKKHTKIVACQAGKSTIEESLPYPYVYYPGFYGAYFAFSETVDSTPFICSCSKESIINYIKFRLKFENRLNANPTKNFLLSSEFFPQTIIENLILQCIPVDDKIINKLSFKDNLCHECNKQTPTLGYCNPMYGGVFKQNFGWYINKQAFEFGVKPVSFQMLDNSCPDELFENVEIQKQEFINKYIYLSEDELLLLKAHDSIYQSQTRKIGIIIENEVRVKFGFKKVGEAWANETLLYQIISQLYPKKKVLRHCRPYFLEHLELDVYIPELQLGFEYQGIQHFEPVEHWGGKRALKQVQQRDKRKNKLCNSNGIKLIYFYYYEELTKELIKSKINNA